MFVNPSPSGAVQPLPETYSPEKLAAVAIWKNVLSFINPVLEYQHFCSFGTVCRQFYNFCVQAVKSSNTFQEWRILDNLDSYVVAKRHVVDTCLIEDPTFANQTSLDRNFWLFLHYDEKDQDYFFCLKSKKHILLTFSPLEKKPFIMIDLSKKKYPDKRISNNSEDHEIVAFMPSEGNKYTIVTNKSIGSWGFVGSSVNSETFTCLSIQPLVEPESEFVSVGIKDDILFILKREKDIIYNCTSRTDNNYNFDALDNRSEIEGSAGFRFFNQDLYLISMVQVGNGWEHNLEIEELLFEHSEKLNVLKFKPIFSSPNHVICDNSELDFSPEYMWGNKFWVPFGRSTGLDVFHLNHQTLDDETMVRIECDKPHQGKLFLRDNYISSMRNSQFVFLPTKENFAPQIYKLFNLDAENSTILSVWCYRNENGVFLRTLNGTVLRGAKIELTVEEVELTKKESSHKKIKLEVLA